MIKCTLNVRGESDFAKMDEANDKLQSDLLAIVGGDVSDKELLDYANTLVARIRKEIGYEGDNFWCVAEVVDGMPGDARVDLIYRPTYLATCILMQAWLRLKELRESESFKAALQGAMYGSMGRRFEGHGFDWYEGFCETLHIFELGRVPEFLEAYPDLNSDFTNLYREAVAFYNGRQSNS